MEGIFIKGDRPKSKKQVKEAIANGELKDVVVQFTSIFRTGPEQVPVEDLADGQYGFVGPDPFSARNFYGTLTVAGSVVKVS